MANLQDKTVGILGLGQVGGSVACTIKANHPQMRVIAYDVKRELLDEASRQNLLDGAADGPTDLIETSDIIILALPVGAIVESIGGLSEPLKAKLLVTDTGSVMNPILSAAENAGLTNYVSGHPLAGTEKRGSEAWLGTLFVGSPYFMTPVKDAVKDAVQAMNDLVELLGAIPVGIRAIAHDQSFATTSNVAHVLAFCLRRSFDRLEDHMIDKSMFACPSYRSATRVAASDPEMVFQMLWHNREFLSGALRSLASELEIVRASLVKGEPDTFRQALGLK